jgi:alkylhydroperoxidase family enzyme
VPADPLRIPPLPPTEWPAEMRAALAPLRPASPPPALPAGQSRPKGLGVLGTFAHHPDLTAAFMTFNAHVLLASTLSDRQRELVILRVAALRDATYEWAQHAVLAGDAGIDDTEVAAVADGPDGSDWSTDERALLQAVDELIGDGTISDPTWAVLSGALDTRQVLDLVFTVGAYDALAMALRTCGTPLDDDLLPD